jgi:erythromycin esterase-like protein
MSKGRKPIWMAGWIQRLLSAFSRLDPDAARAAQESANCAGTGNGRKPRRAGAKRAEQLAECIDTLQKAAIIARNVDLD